MEPLNKQERTEAFVKVLALFLISIILVAIPMYYAFRLPNEEKKRNLTESEGLQQQIKNMKDLDRQFLMKTDSALVIYNKYVLEQEKMIRDKWRSRYSDLSTDLEDFTKPIPYDTLKMLYTNTNLTFDKLFIGQDKIYDLRDSLAKCKGGPVPPPEPVGIRFYNIVRDTYYKNNRNKKRTGLELGLKEGTTSDLIKDLHL